MLNVLSGAPPQFSLMLEPSSLACPFASDCTLLSLTCVLVKSTERLMVLPTIFKLPMRPC
ncbi:hypothetical protein D3C71_2021260 [compost metagenome]